MIALLSAVLGFASSGIPEFIRLFRESKDRAHEIALLKLQMEYDREKIALAREAEQMQRATRLQEIELQAEMNETQALNARVVGNKVDVVWVDALAGSVRPTITYLFFLLYAMTKWAQFQLLKDSATFEHAIISLWSEDDMAIFTAIIAFWFGQRMLSKIGKVPYSAR